MARHSSNAILLYVEDVHTHHLGHIALDHQRVLKRQVLTEALDRFAGEGLVAPEIEAVDSARMRANR